MKFTFVREDTVPKILAFIAEMLIAVCAVWLIAFLSTFLHELGHALGYMLAAKDASWHIRVGWGKRLFASKALTVNLAVFDGVFIPSENKLDTKAKQIAMLAGGPAVSLLLVAGLSVLKFVGFSFESGILSDGVIEFFADIAFFANLFILLLSVFPGRYFYGQVKGMETDGLKILRALKKRGE